MRENQGGVAFLVKNGNSKTINTAGSSRQFGAGDRYDSSLASFREITFEDNIASIYTTYGTFAALTDNGKIITWGQFTSEQETGDKSVIMEVIMNKC